MRKDHETLLLLFVLHGQEENIMRTLVLLFVFPWTWRKHHETLLLLFAFAWTWRRHHETFVVVCLVFHAQRKGGGQVAHHTSIKHPHAIAQTTIIIEKRNTHATEDKEQPQTNKLPSQRKHFDYPKNCSNYLRTPNPRNPVVLQTLGYCVQRVLLRQERREEIPPPFSASSSLGRPSRVAVALGVLILVLSCRCYVDIFEQQHFLSSLFCLIFSLRKVIALVFRLFCFFV